MKYDTMSMCTQGKEAAGLSAQQKRIDILILTTHNSGVSFFPVIRTGIFPFRRTRRMRFKKPQFSQLDYSMLKPSRLFPRIRDAVIGGWYFPDDEHSQNRMNLLLFALINNIVANLVGGNYFTGLLLLMDADDSFIGLVGMLPFAANIVQLIAPMIIERFTQRKKFLILFRFMALMVNALFISIIPFMPVAQQLKLTMVALALIFVNCTHAMLNPGFCMWHMQFLPNRFRAAYFSTQSIAVAVIVAAVTMGASALVDVFKANGAEITGIMVVRGIAVD